APWVKFPSGGPVQAQAFGLQLSQHLRQMRMQGGLGRGSLRAGGPGLTGLQQGLSQGRSCRRHGVIEQHWGQAARKEETSRMRLWTDRQGPRLAWARRTVAGLMAWCAVGTIGAVGSLIP